MLLRLDAHVHTRFSKSSASSIASLVSHCLDNGLVRRVKAVERAGEGPNPLLRMVYGYVKIL